MRQLVTLLIVPHENQREDTLFNTISSSNEGLSLLSVCLNEVLSYILITLSQDLWYENENKQSDIFEQLWQTQDNQGIISFETQDSSYFHFAEKFIGFSQTSFCKRHMEEILMGI